MYDQIILILIKHINGQTAWNAWINSSRQMLDQNSGKKNNVCQVLKIIQKMWDFFRVVEIMCFSWFHSSTARNAVKTVENPNRSVNARWTKSLTANGVTNTHHWNYLFLPFTLFLPSTLVYRPPHLTRAAAYTCVCAMCVRFKSNPIEKSVSTGQMSSHNIWEIM